MRPSSFLLVLAGLNGTALVGLGAWGAHAFVGDDLARSLYDTAWLYHAIHAVVLLALVPVAPLSRLAMASGLVIFVGTVLFSGTLYVRAMGLFVPVPMTAPTGGIMLMTGWLMIAASGIALAIGRRRA